MTGGLTKIGASLIAVFALCVAIIAADLAYVLWRRRRFHLRSSSAGDSVPGAGDSSVYVLSSKELLYFLCWKNQSRIEPNDHRQVNAVVNGSDRPAGESAAERENEDDGDDDVLKLNDMYGRPRLLFTIKEEEESNSAVDGQSQRSASDGQNREIGDVAVPGVIMTVDHDDNATPFSTPCASPPYYTPSPSPSRDEVKRSHESYGEVQFVSLDIIGA